MTTLAYDKLYALYHEVKRFVQTGTGTTTTLWEWLAEGDTEGVSVKDLAREWDELNSVEAETDWDD